MLNYRYRSWLKVLMISISTHTIMPALTYAQSLTLNGNLNETMSSSVKISGSTLKGAVLGENNGKAGFYDVKIPVSNKTTSVVPLCILATTRDGNYHANGVFQVPANSRGDATLLTKSKFENQLSKYNRDEFSIVGRFGKDCNNNPSTPIVPIKYSSKPELTLALQIIGLKTKVQLIGGNGTIVDAKCSKNSALRNVAFNFVCTLDLSGFETQQKTQIKVSVQQKSGEWGQSEYFLILLNG